MKVKCVACGWEYDFEGFEYDWSQCPECDFPYKYQDWIIQLQTRTAELERENTVLATKLSAMVNAD